MWIERAVGKEESGRLRGYKGSAQQSAPPIPSSPPRTPVRPSSEQALQCHPANSRGLPSGLSHLLSSDPLSFSRRRRLLSSQHSFPSSFHHLLLPLSVVSSSHTFPLAHPIFCLVSLVAFHTWALGPAQQLPLPQSGLLSGLLSAEPARPPT